jgi:hypothetical protein
MPDDVSRSRHERTASASDVRHAGSAIEVGAVGIWIDAISGQSSDGSPEPVPRGITPMT